MNTTYKVALVTLCYNESKIMPFVIDYWKRFVTHAYVFDNGSTDDSKEILNKYDWISVIDYSHLTGNKLDDIMNMNIKNNFWKVIKDNYDFIVVCDFDECLYCERWDNVLNVLDSYGIFCVIPTYYNMITYKFPDYVENKLFHEINKYYVNVNNKDQHRLFNKMLIFNCKNVYELNLSPGSHQCKPICISSNSITQILPIKLTEIKCYHLADVGLDYIIEKRNHNKNERITDKQIKHHFAVHYMLENDEITKEFNEKWNNKIELS